MGVDIPKVVEQPCMVEVLEPLGKHCWEKTIILDHYYRKIVRLCYSYPCWKAKLERDALQFFLSGRGGCDSG